MNGRLYEFIQNPNNWLPKIILPEWNMRAYNWELIINLKVWDFKRVFRIFLTISFNFWLGKVFIYLAISTHDFGCRFRINQIFCFDCLVLNVSRSIHQQNSIKSLLIVALMPDKKICLNKTFMQIWIGNAFTHHSRKNNNLALKS